MPAAPRVAFVWQSDVGVSASTGGKHRFAFGWESKIRKTDEFSSVFRFRCAKRGQALTVLLAPNGCDQARLGLIVPKRVLPRAVDRNRMRRLLREWFRLRQSELQGLDVIAQVKSVAHEEVFKAEFSTALDNARKRVDALVHAPRQSE